MLNSLLKLVRRSWSIFFFLTAARTVGSDSKANQVYINALVLVHYFIVTACLADRLNKLRKEPPVSEICNIQR